MVNFCSTDPWSVRDSYNCVALMGFKFTCANFELIYLFILASCYFIVATCVVWYSHTKALISPRYSSF